MDGHSESRDRFTFGALMPWAEADLCWEECKEQALANYELRSGEEVVARLRFRDPAGLVAIGEAAGGAWSLTDEGMVRPRIRIRSLADQGTLAVYKSRLPGLPGSLEFPDGRQLCWRRLGLRVAAHRFEDAQGTPVVVVRCRCKRSWLSGPRVTKGLVEVESHAYGIADLIPLLMLAWYLIVVQQHSVRFLILPYGGC